MNGLLRSLRLLVLRAWLPIGIVVAWWLVSATSTSFYFPPLQEIFLEIWNQWILGPRLVSDLLPSLADFAIGFFTAILLGTVIGVLIGRSAIGQATVAPIINFFRALPSPALVPIMLALFGIGPNMNIAVIVVGAIWPTLLNTVDGVRALDTQVREVTRSYRLTRWQTVSQVVLPSAAPQIFAGYRISLQIAIILIVVSEMVGATHGLGYQVIESQQLFRVTQTWAGTIILGVLGYLLTSAFLLVERRVLAWHVRMRIATGAG